MMRYLSFAYQLVGKYNPVGGKGISGEDRFIIYDLQWYFAGAFAGTIEPIEFQVAGGGVKGNSGNRPLRQRFFAVTIGQHNLPLRCQVAGTFGSHVGKMEHQYST